MLYVSGEESAQQVKLRADRLGIHDENILFLGETDIDVIDEQIVSITLFSILSPHTIRLNHFSLFLKI